MRKQNNYLATAPFDVYELYLFRLVVQHRSFTRAAELAGLTQSAITRQMQTMESSLGIDLLERTTRSVRVTAAGEFLFKESARLLGDVDSILQRLREEFGSARKEVRVGVSQTIGLAYLPGFFHANLRRLPSVGCRVSYLPSNDILMALQSNDLDLGVLCPPTRFPKSLSVTHRFQDAFTLVVPEAGKDGVMPPVRARDLGKWVKEQNWLLVTDQSNTGQRLRRWFAQRGWNPPPFMELDSFDLIINLVALGMGVSFVPTRALALYGQKKSIRRIALRERFTRELVVVSRKRRKMPEHLSQFISNILF